MLEKILEILSLNKGTKIMLEDEDWRYEVEFYSKENYYLIFRDADNDLTVFEVQEHNIENYNYSEKDKSLHINVYNVNNTIKE